MTTRELIEAALQAQTDYDTAASNMAAATTALQNAKVALADANQAVHDDLAANGPAVIVDESVDPITVTLYTAAEPDTFTATPIRVAG